MIVRYEWKDDLVWIYRIVYGRHICVFHMTFWIMQVKDFYVYKCKCRFIFDLASCNPHIQICVTEKIWKYVFLTISVCWILIISSLMGFGSLNRTRDRCESLTHVLTETSLYPLLLPLWLCLGNTQWQSSWSAACLLVILFSHLHCHCPSAHWGSFLCRAVLYENSFCLLQFTAKPNSLSSMLTSASCALCSSWHQLKRFNGLGDQWLILPLTLFCFSL